MNRIQTKVYLLFFVLIACGFSKAQPGVPATPYCYPIYTSTPCNNPGPSNAPGNFVNEFVHSVITIGAVIDINNPNTGCNAQSFASLGVRNYIYHKCQHNLSVMPGQAITCSVQVGNFYPQGVAIFIDWNGDNVFQNPAERVAASVSTIAGGGWGAFTINTPVSQPNGIYRMRVRCALNTAGISIDACNTNSGGEAEDYDVYVGTTSPVITNIVASSNSTLCSGNTLSLTLTYSAQCTPSYTWVGPNGFFSSLQNPTIANAQPPNSGNYTVTVMCGTACPVSTTTSVTISQGPTPANAGSIICTCASSATLNANTPSIGTGSWTLISGSAVITNPTSPNSGVTAIAIGTNVLQWTTTNGNCISTSTMAIIRDPLPSTANAGPNQTITCSGNTVTMAGNTPAIGTGTWTVLSGSGTFVSPNSPNSLVTGVGTGTNVYVWSIGYNSYCSCQPTSQSTMAVVNINSISVNAVSSSSVACANFSPNISASGATTYTWTGSAFAGSIVAQNISVPSGTYQVVGSTGSCTGTMAVVIGTTNIWGISISQSDFTVCPGKQVLLVASWANSYSWQPCVSLSSCTGASVNASPSVTTQYTVVGLTSSCTETGVITVTFVPGPGVTASSNSSLICAGDQATLTASGAANYSWIPAGSGSVIVVNPGSTTIYTVTGATLNGCSNTTTVSQNVSPCTSVIDHSPLEGIRVYPNPAGDILNFVLKEKSSITVYDINGKLVLKRTVKERDKIDVSELDKGIYLLYFDKDIEPVKIIKE